MVSLIFIWVGFAFVVRDLEVPVEVRTERAQALAGEGQRGQRDEQREADGGRGDEEGQAPGAAGADVVDDAQHDQRPHAAGDDGPAAGALGAGRNPGDPP